MNKREVFNRVKEHLLKQGLQALDDDRECVYRGNNGTKCAVGCLITDEAYSPYIERFNADDECVIKALVASGINVDNVGDETFLYKLQRIHDSFKPSEWLDKLNEFEEEHLSNE